MIRRIVIVPNEGKMTLDSIEAKIAEARASGLPGETEMKRWYDPENTVDRLVVEAPVDISAMRVDELHAQATAEAWDEILRRARAAEQVDA